MKHFKYIATKLGITTAELQQYLTMPKKFYWDYKNQERIFNLGAKILKALGFERSIKRLDGLEVFSVKQ
jgi:GTP cyclohydrolase II